MSLTKDRILVWEFMSQLYYNLTILNISYNWQILEYEYNVYNMSGKLLAHEYEFNVHVGVGRRNLWQTVFVTYICKWSVSNPGKQRLLLSYIDLYMSKFIRCSEICHNKMVGNDCRSFKVHLNICQLEQLVHMMNNTKNSKPNLQIHIKNIRQYHESLK